MSELTTVQGSERAEQPQSTAVKTARIGMDVFNRWAATFRDEDAESSYRRYLTTSNLPQQRLVWLLMTGVYFLYGALDVLTIKERLNDVLVVRCLIITPLALALGALTYVERLKSYTGHLFAACVFLSAISVTWMISVLPPQGAPPYIVGVLIIFIFSSCNVQMPFVSASAAYILTSAAYAYVVLSNPEFSRNDVIAGLFFMISSAVAAVATNYVQEIRLRMIWMANELRAEDARRIAQLMIEATAADSSKLNFLSVLTHELRTPLHQVIGLSEVVRDQVQRGAITNADELLSQTIESAHGQLKKIGQMLRYADATAGRLTFDFDDVPVADMIETLHDQFSGKAVSRRVTLKIGPVEKVRARIDPHHTAFALANIMDNAVNASKPGGFVHVSGRALDDDTYQIAITDQGCGISAERLRTIFSPFEQTDQTYSRSGGGIGLGLTLAKRLLEPQGATIELKSHPELGTSAFVTLKRAKSAATATRIPSAGDDNLSRSAQA